MGCEHDVHSGLYTAQKRDEMFCTLLAVKRYGSLGVEHFTVRKLIKMGKGMVHNKMRRTVKSKEIYECSIGKV